MLSLLFFLVGVCPSKRRRWMYFSGSFPSVSFAAFFDFLSSWRASPSLRSGSCLLFLCDFSLANRIYSRGFNSHLFAAFSSLLSSGLHFQLPAEWTCPLGYPTCIFPNLIHQVSSGIFIFVKETIIIFWVSWAYTLFSFVTVFFFFPQTTVHALLI